MSYAVRDYLFVSILISGVQDAELNFLLHKILYNSANFISDVSFPNENCLYDIFLYSPLKIFVWNFLECLSYMFALHTIEADYFRRQVQMTNGFLILFSRILNIIFAFNNESVALIIIFGHTSLPTIFVLQTSTILSFTNAYFIL